MTGSFLSQVEQCERKAAELGATVVRVFEDAGVSSESVKFPALDSAVDHCQESPPDYLFTVNLGRLSRHKDVAERYEKTFAELGVKPIYLNSSTMQA